MNYFFKYLFLLRPFRIVNLVPDQEQRVVQHCCEDVEAGGHYHVGRREDFLVSQIVMALKVCKNVSISETHQRCVIDLLDQGVDQHGGHLTQEGP